MDEALAAYERAIELAPAYADAHLNRALSCLLRGDWGRGWPEYEWRFKSRPNSERRFAQPRWDGSSLKRKTLFLHCEQGLGDTIQFIRYARHIKRRGARLVVRCEPRFLPLLSRLRAIDQLVTAGDPLPAFDYHLPLLSLPGVFGTTLETVPDQVPYLSADEGLVRFWRERLKARQGAKETSGQGEEEAEQLAATDGQCKMQNAKCKMQNDPSGSRPGSENLAPQTQDLRPSTSRINPKSKIENPKSLLVGINWQGNVKFDGDRQRSFPVACFAPLAQLAGVRLVSLQKGIAHEQLARLHRGGHAGEEAAEESGQWIVGSGQLAAECGAQSSATRPHPGPLPKGALPCGN